MNEKTIKSPMDHNRVPQLHFVPPGTPMYVRWAPTYTTA